MTFSVSGKMHSYRNLTQKRVCIQCIQYCILFYHLHLHGLFSGMRPHWSCPTLFRSSADGQQDDEGFLLNSVSIPPLSWSPSHNYLNRIRWSQYRTILNHTSKSAEKLQEIFDFLVNVNMQTLRDNKPCRHTACLRDLHPLLVYIPQGFHHPTDTEETNKQKYIGRECC